MSLFHWDDRAADDISQKRKLVSVCACVGWAVHGVVFVFDNGQRGGVLLSNSAYTMPLDDMSIMSRSECHWAHVTTRGDFIVRVSGNQLANSGVRFLCHRLDLEFASGQTMSFASKYIPWKGERFSYLVNQPFLVTKLNFERDVGCVGFDGLQTSIHLPVEKSTAAHLPPECKKRILLLLLIAQRSDNERCAFGEKGVNEEIWWSMILSYLNGYDLSTP